MAVRCRFARSRINANLLSTFIIVLVALGLITVPYVVRGLVRFKRPETLLITSVGLCFAFAMIAERLGYTVVLGAFLAGLFVAESEQGAVVEKLIEPVRHIFGAIFFVGVGMLIEPQLLARSWLALAALTVVAIVGKTVFVSLASLLIGEHPDTALKPDLQTRRAARSQSFFALAARGDAKGGLLYCLPVALKAVTSVLCPLLVRASIPAPDWIDRHLPVRVHNALSQYGAWLDRDRKLRQTEKH
jgi:CPA2 family monovalent cation:H+ antiporter-2